MTRNPTPSCPFSALEIEINHECNRACSYCPNSVASRVNQGLMPRKLFIKLMEELRELDYRGRVSYHFYNEPLLSPDLDTYVALTREYLPGCWIEIFTNGDLLTEERLSELVKLGTDRFTVTRHQNSEGHLYPEILERLEPAHRKRVFFQNFRDLTFTNRAGILGKLGYHKTATPLALPCLIPSTLLVVTVNGNVLPCYEDFHEKHVMGNLTDQTLMEIWNGPNYAHFRSTLQSGRREAMAACHDCNSLVVVP